MSGGFTITQYMLPEGPIMMDTATGEQLERIGDLHGITRGHDATGALEPDSEFRARLLKSLESRKAYFTESEKKAFFDPDSQKEFVQIDMNEINNKAQQAFQNQQIQDFLTALDKL